MPLSKLIFDNIVLIPTGFALTAMFVFQLMLFTEWHCAEVVIGLSEDEKHKHRSLKDISGQRMDDTEYTWST